MNSILQDLRYAVRLLGASRTFTLAAMLSLTLGIGANSATFSLVYAVLLKPLPYAEPDRLVAIREYAPGDPSALDNVSPANYADWKARARSFAAMAAFIDSYASAYNLTGVGEAERIRAIGATDGFFAALGVTPLLGRELHAGENRTDRTLVLTHAFWQRKFGGDARAIGRQVSLDGEPHTIIGVLPETFQFSRRGDVWRQFNPDTAGGAVLADRATRWWTAIGRLAPDATLASAQREITAIAEQLEREHPRENARRGARVRTLREELTGAAAPPLAILYGAVCLVLVVACANVAGLLLARLMARRREFAVRVALGAGRWRVARQLIAESLVLALPAACAGLLLASWLLRGMIALAPVDLPRLAEVTVNGWIVLFTAATSVASALAFGLVPIVHAYRIQPAPSLRQGRDNTPGSQRIRAVLVVGELAVAMVLLVGAGLLVRSYARLSAVDVGFKPRGVISLDVATQSPAYVDWKQIVAFHDRALQEVSTLPGVRSAAVASLAPFAEGRFEEHVRRADGSNQERQAEYRFVSAGYFSTMGIALRAGREFTRADRPGAERVAILGASTAARLFGDEDPIGKSIVVRSRIRRVVVGVVADTRLYGFGSAPPLQVYAPYPQADDTFWTGMTFVIRADGDAGTTIAAARQRLLAIDPTLPPFNVGTLERHMAGSLAPARLYASMLGVFAIVAALLACVGLYGLIAYLVGTRTREFGIRLALGATPARMERLVLREAAALVALAIVIGAAGALAGTRILARLLFEVTPGDWTTFALVVPLLAGVAILASYAPARRVTRIDPMTTLRSE